MDCRQNNSASWEWQRDNHYAQKDSNLDVPKCVWNGASENQQEISYIFDETTPVKACGDLILHVDNDIMIKTPQEYREYSSQVKRRRMLDFDDASAAISTSYLKSKERIESIDELMPEMSWEECFQVDDDFGQSEAWLADCLNDTDINISSESISDDGVAGASDAQNVMTDVHDCALVSPPKVAQRTVRSSTNIIFKGKKSFMKTPTKLASSVAYPFDFVKPCGVRGDVTLKDINQKIRTPPPKPQVKEDPPVLQISAISGKPVIGKTKIPTQGGRGSITIMRTKG